MSQAGKFGHEANNRLPYITTHYAPQKGGVAQRRGQTYRGALCIPSLAASRLVKCGIM